jgi:predicted DNA-binding protein
MATSKPRITVSLTERQHEVLRSISETSGKPISTFVSELLEMSLPTLERMATAFHKIKQAQEVERKWIVSELDKAQAAIEPVVQQVPSTLNTVTDIASPAVISRTGRR